MGRRGTRALATILIACATLVFAEIALAAAPVASVPHGIPIDSLLQPPPVNGKPLQILIGLHVINIAWINEVNEQFQLDAYFFARWNDPRLSYTPSDPDDKERDYAMGEIWVPRLEMINAATPRQRYDVSIRVSPEGTVKYEERCVVSLSSKFRLRRFPFDQQQLVVIIHPFLADGPAKVFKLDEQSTWTASEFTSYSSLAQWRLLSLSSSIATAPTYGKMTVPEARFEISVGRRSTFYLWKVFVPLLLMVFLSWAVFWIEADDLSNQIQVAVTTILTVIAFAFAITATMPRLPYLTYIDAFFLQCYIFVFLAVVELMTVHVTHRSEARRDLGARIRRYSRWVIPGLFVVSNIVIATHFLG